MLALISCRLGAHFYTIHSRRSAHKHSTASALSTNTWLWFMISNCTRFLIIAGMCRISYNPNYSSLWSHMGVGEGLEFGANFDVSPERTPGVRRTMRITPNQLCLLNIYLDLQPDFLLSLPKSRCMDFYCLGKITFNGKVTVRVYILFIQAIWMSIHESRKLR